MKKKNEREKTECRKRREIMRMEGERDRANEERHTREGAE